MAACILLAAQLFVPLLAAQGIRRTADSHPGLGRRIVGNCTAADSNCNFCAAAFLVTWSLREVGGNVKTVTLQEVVNEDGSVDLETITAGWNSDDAAAWTSSLELGTQGPHTSLVENLGFVMTYPTSYVVFQDSYIWQGTLFTDNTCAISTDAPAEVKGPTPTVQALPGGTFSALEGTITDKAGYHFDLALADSLFDANLGANFNDGAFKLCNAGCDGFVGFTTPATPVTPAGPPQLTVAFATACQRSTKGVDGVVKLGDGDCTAVKAPSPASPSGGGSGGGSGGSGGSAGSGSQSGGGGGGSGGGGETRVTTTDSKGSTVIMNVGGGGGETRVTTTDSKGSTVIMNVGGGNLYTSVNVQGQTVVGTGAANAGPMGGQITLTNSDGATIVVQGGSLASPGAGNGGGITVTDVRGSLMVVQGGETGTLSAMPGGGTALIAATLTQTSWVAGDTISAGAAASSSTEPGVQSEAGSARLPSLLGMSALLLSTMLMGVMIL